MISDYQEKCDVDGTGTWCGMLSSETTVFNTLSWCNIAHVAFEFVRHTKDLTSYRDGISSSTFQERLAVSLYHRVFPGRITPFNEMKSSLLFCFESVIHRRSPSGWNIRLILNRKCNPLFTPSASVLLSPAAHRLPGHFFTRLGYLRMQLLFHQQFQSTAESKCNFKSEHCMAAS